MSVTISATGILSLLVMIVQNFGTYIVVQLTLDDERRTLIKYSKGTAVVTTEFLKLTAALCAEYIINHRSFSLFIRHIFTEVFVKYRETCVLIVPALLYALQNNMLYYANQNLDGITFQITYQLKIVTTALFSRWMLAKPLSIRQWVSLIILILGIIMVQPSKNGQPDNRVKNHTMGLLVTVLSAISSGFAGVFTEKMIKRSDHPVSKKSLWVQNCIIACYGIVFSYIALFLQDYFEPRVTSFFHGYTSLVCLNLAMQALGGVLVSLVMKYADNILKGFACAIVLVLNAIYSITLRGSVMTAPIGFGIVCVIVSVVVYGIEEAKHAKSPPSNRKLSFPNTTLPPDDKTSVERQNGSNRNRHRQASKPNLHKPLLHAV
jgi:solute carrier family 35 (UDP-sugar transporter), member A1/2/3